jgi:hypothetical protein
MPNLFLCGSHLLPCLSASARTFLSQWLSLSLRCSLRRPSPNSITSPNTINESTQSTIQLTSGFFNCETSRPLKDVPRTQDSRTQNSNLVCSSCMSCISCMVHQYAAPYDKSSPHHSPFTIHHPTQNPKLTTGPPPCVLQNISSHRSSTHHCHRR